VIVGAVAGKSRKWLAGARIREKKQRLYVERLRGRKGPYRTQRKQQWLLLWGEGTNAENFLESKGYAVDITGLEGRKNPRKE